LALLALSATVMGDGHAYVVIANPNAGVSSVDRGFLADAFLKKTTSWPGGATIRPVDQRASSPVRRAFSEDVLHRSISEVKGYWQQRIFSGRDVPPPELDNDDDVVGYVMRYDGAVGYVSASTQLHGARVISIR
ncbi:MAG: hypothetical protein ACRELY_01345, partial [Polyangiaceae bacterium]